MTKLESQQVQTDHRRPFGRHLSYYSSDKTHIGSRARLYDKGNKYEIWKKSGDIKMSKCPQVQTDRLWSFWRLSWLADQAQIQSLIKVIHIRNLKAIR